MKKVFFAIVFTLISSTIFAQGLNFSTKEKLNTNKLIGYWEPDQESATLFFWKDIEGKLQTQQISQTSGLPFDLIYLKEINNTVVIKTIFKPTNFEVECTYTFVNDTTLKCAITGNKDVTITFRKKK